MINETLNTPAKLQAALGLADVLLSSLPSDTPYQNFELRYVDYHTLMCSAAKCLNICMKKSYFLEEIIPSRKYLYEENTFVESILLFVGHWNMIARKGGAEDSAFYSLTRKLFYLWVNMIFPQKLISSYSPQQ